MEAILSLSDFSGILDILITIIFIAIAVVGLYIYFTIDKEMKFLLIGLGFLLFFIGGLATLTTLFDDNLLTPWNTTFVFLGAICVLLSVEPWKIMKK